MEIDYDFFYGSSEDFPEMELHYLFRRLLMNETSIDTILHEVPLYKDLLLGNTLIIPELVELETDTVSLNSKKNLSIKIDYNNARLFFCKNAEESHAKVHYTPVNSVDKDSYHNALFFVMNGVSIGYIKMTGMSTFLASQTVRDDNNDLILVHGGMYFVPQWTNCHNYVSGNRDGRYLVAEIDTLDLRPGRLLIPAVFEKRCATRGGTVSFLGLLDTLNYNAEQVASTQESTATMKYVGTLDLRNWG